MSNVLKENIRLKLEKAGLNTNQAESMAGLKISAIRNILNGKSKNPGIDVIHSLAKILNCSIDELITTPNFAKASSQDKDNPIENYALFINIATLIANHLKEKDIEVPQSRYIKFIKEVYEYAIIRNDELIDKEFIEWYVGKNLE